MATQTTGRGTCSKVISSFSLSYTWTIPKFHELKGSVAGHKLLSPTFGSLGEGGAAWQLSAYPNGESEATKGQISVFLRASLLSPGTTSVLVTHRWDVGGVTASDRNHIAQLGKGWPSYAAQDSLQLGPNGELALKVRLEWGDKATLKLTKALFNDHLADITLKVGPHRIPAHRVVLAAHSPVFERMFAHKDFAENHNKEVEMADVSKSVAASLGVVRHFLAFLYTGEFVDPARDAHSLVRYEGSLEDLVRLGDLYDVAGLKYAAESELLHRLSGRSFCSVARLHRHSQRILHACQDFVEAKRGEIPEEEWAGLEKEDNDFCLKLLHHFVPLAKKQRRA